MTDLLIASTSFIKKKYFTYYIYNYYTLSFLIKVYIRLHRLSILENMH